MATVIGKNLQHIKQCTCIECASVVEYTLSEVEDYIHHDYGGGKDTVYYIVCPACGYKIKVNRY